MIRSTIRTFEKRRAIDAHLVPRTDDLGSVENTFTNFLTLVEFTDGPNGGMRRDDLAARGGSTTSGSAGVTVGPSSTYSSGGTRSIARSSRAIGGFITALSGAIGAAFRRKRRAS